MKWVTRKPSLGAGKFSKSIAGMCWLTVLRFSYALEPLPGRRTATARGS
jgi:hypothetical protein